MNAFERPIEIRWSDVDQNRHVRHSAYYDYGAYVRIQFLDAAGFDAKSMEQHQVGPILFKEECNFIREIKPTDRIRMNMLRGEISSGGLKWVIHHEIYNQDDVKVAHITIFGAWMDIIKRKLIKPIGDLASVFEALPMGEAYRRK